MKNVLILALSVLFVSCGKDGSYMYYTDDLRHKATEDKISIIESKNLLYDAKIEAIELRLASLESDNEELSSQYDSLLDLLEDLENQVDTLEDDLNRLIVPIPVKVCSSNEHLLKIGDDYFAVYMVSNNNGTFFGKLQVNIHYNTTDGNNVSFKVTINKTIQCL